MFACALIFVCFLKDEWISAFFFLQCLTLHCCKLLSERLIIQLCQHLKQFVDEFVKNESCKIHPSFSAICVEMNKVFVSPPK